MKCQKAHFFSALMTSELIVSLLRSIQESLKLTYRPETCSNKTGSNRIRLNAIWTRPVSSPRSSLCLDLWRLTVWPQLQIKYNVSGTGSASSRGAHFNHFYKLESCNTLSLETNECHGLHHTWPVCSFSLTCIFLFIHLDQPFSTSGPRTTVGPQSSGTAKWLNSNLFKFFYL